MFSIEPLNDVTSTVSCYSFIQEKVVAKFSPLFKIMVSVREGQVDRQPQKKYKPFLLFSSFNLFTTCAELEDCIIK